jgi:IS30 family transposase
MPKDKGKKLNLDDRITIASRIEVGNSFSLIARYLNVAPSTVSREVRINRIDRGFRKGNPNHCLHPDCFLKRVCGEKLCTKDCASCRKKNCNDYCKHYEEIVCPKLKKAPYVCNGCSKIHTCGMRRFFYQAKRAHHKAEMRKSQSRSGIDAEQNIFDPLLGQIIARLSRGQSPAHIWTALGEEIPFSERSFYRHIQKGCYGLNAFNLPRKVRYKVRNKQAETFYNASLEGKTYADWLLLDEEERIYTVQIDCIKGKRFEKEAILSLHFCLWHFQLYVPLAIETAQEVDRALDALELYCEGSFSKHFGTLLADRGSGFTAWDLLEESKEGNRRCALYYCDARHPEQKGACEKNHVEFRRIVPKGSAIANLGSNELAHIMSHVNSYSRPSLGGKTPYDLASQVLPKSLFEALGIVKIASESVTLTPELLKDF